MIDYNIFLLRPEHPSIMAPQTSIPVAANVLGTIGTVFWCIQLVPQIWYNYKKKKTDGLPALMMFLWALCWYFHAWKMYVG